MEQDLINSINHYFPDAEIEEVENEDFYAYVTPKIAKCIDWHINDDDSISFINNKREIQVKKEDITIENFIQAIYKVLDYHFVAIRLITNKPQIVSYSEEVYYYLKYEI